MPSERRLRRFVRRWRRRYPHPVDWVDDRANRQCRRSENEWLAAYGGVAQLRRREVRALISWAFTADPERRERALQGTIAPAAWGHARRRIRRALAAEHATEALDLLLESQGGVTGWDVEVASAVLAGCRPDDYVAADGRRLQALEALGLVMPRRTETVAREDWLPFVKACRRLSRVAEVPLVDVQRALWAAADRAPELPERIPRTRRTAPGGRGSSPPRSG